MHRPCHCAASSFGAWTPATAVMLKMKKTATEKSMRPNLPYIMSPLRAFENETTTVTLVVKTLCDEMNMIQIEKNEH